MLLDWKCQDCGRVEWYHVEKGSTLETVEWWQEETKDYLCPDCGLKNRMERIESGYYLD